MLNFGNNNNYFFQKNGKRSKGSGAFFLTYDERNAFFLNDWSSDFRIYCTYS